MMIAPRAVSPLVAYALDGLRRCWMPEHGRYSYRYRFDQEPANESHPAGDVFYTLNVLLGIARLPQPALAQIDAREVYARCGQAAATLQLRIYGYGVALWAGAALGLAPPGPVADRIRTMLDDDALLFRMTAQDVGMLVSGLVAQSAGDQAWRAPADRLVRHLREHFHDPATRLFCNQARGYRRGFSSFASQVYALLALYHYGEAFGQEPVLRLANEAAASLISLQGGRGEWGWFYYVPQRRVVDFYEIYSVHQHGMAPAFLHHAVRHGVAGAREAIVTGFGWLFGDNEIGRSMLRPQEGMFYRSQLRRGERDGTWRRAARSVANAALHRGDAVDRHAGLDLRPECRSYELGWILWSWGGREDYPELTHRAEFLA